MGLSTVVGLGGCVVGGEGEGEGLLAGAAFSAAFIAAHSALPTLGALAAGGDVRPTPLAALPPRAADCDHPAERGRGARDGATEWSRGSRGACLRIGAA